MDGYCNKCGEIVFGIGMHDVKLSPKQFTTAAAQVEHRQPYGDWHAHCVASCPDFPDWRRELHNWIGSVLQARLIGGCYGADLFIHKNSRDFIYLGQRGEMLRFTKPGGNVLDTLKLPYMSVFQCDNVVATVDRGDLARLFSGDGPSFSRLCEALGCSIAYENLNLSEIVVKPLYGDLEDTIQAIAAGGFECEFSYEVELPAWIADHIA